MNRTKIEYADFTWNPVTGCLHGCPYCYARRFAERGLGEYGKHPKGERFAPRFHPERLDEPQKRKKPSRIFVCSMADLFGDWIDTGTLEEVLQASADASWHTYLWLTKNPECLPIITWQQNDWVGVSVPSNEQLESALCSLSRCNASGRGPAVRFISFEPLLGPITLPDEAAEVLDWIIIGAQTGPGAGPVNIEWISDIQRWGAGHEIPVFIKNNCGWWSRYQEYPGMEG